MRSMAYRWSYHTTEGETMSKLEKEYRPEVLHTQLCLRVCGYEMDCKLIELILEFEASLENFGDDMTIKDILSIKRRHMKDDL